MAGWVETAGLPGAYTVSQSGPTEGRTRVFFSKEFRPILGGSFVGGFQESGKGGLRAGGALCEFMFGTVLW